VGTVRNIHLADSISGLRERRRDRRKSREGTKKGRMEKRGGGPPIF